MKVAFDFASTSSSAGFWHLQITDIVQIIFWLAIGTVTVLTYRQAKRTILQPLRTEVFKLQLETMNRLLALLVGKGEVELRKYFALPEALEANTVAMLDAYAKAKFGIQIDPKDRPYAPDRCPSALASAKLLESADELIEPPAMRSDEATAWDQYEHDLIHVPRGFSIAEETLSTFLSNPLIPMSCASRIQALMDAAQDSILQLGPLITEYAKELPDKCPSLDFLAEVSLTWLNNPWNRRMQPLLPFATDLVEYTREYFASDAFALQRPANRIDSVIRRRRKHGSADKWHNG